MARPLKKRPPKVFKVWIPVSATGRPWIAHCRRRKKDLPRNGWVKKGEYSNVIELFPLRATLTLTGKHNK